MAASGPMAKRWAHFEFLKTLHEKLDFMKYDEEGGREVQFWHVPRERTSRRIGWRTGLLMNPLGLSGSLDVLIVLVCS
jgi:hypothetical protein